MIVFITHPEVVIDPDQPVPDWPLSAKGRARMEQFAEALAGQPIAAVWSSAERKAMDGAQILADRLGVEHRIDVDLHENDRSSTGYVAPPEFWEIVEAFFAHPTQSIRGWETAQAAQTRIVRAVARVAAAVTAPGLVLIVSHGGVGRLLSAHLQGVEIGQEDRPGNPGGGCCLTVSRDEFSLTGTWCDMEAWRAP